MVKAALDILLSACFHAAMNIPAELSELILQLLKQHPAGLSEHQLINQLRKLEVEPFLTANLQDPLSLFRTHFVLFHLLYQLDGQLAAHKLQLQIHTLCICLQPRTSSAAAVIRPDPLRNYYLDLTQLADTDREQVEQLLNGSLRRINQQDELEQALACLGFDTDDKYPCSHQIRRNYRQLVSRHHPDRGGDTTQIQQINQALTTLRAHQLL